MRDNPDLNKQLAKALTLAQCLVGAGPLKLASALQLERTAASLLELKDRIEAIVDSNAEISVGYCQNAELEAAGSITIRGPLAYNCQVSAGDELVIQGECRSGTFHAQTSIRAHTVGTGSMGITRLAVGEGALFAPQPCIQGCSLELGLCAMKSPLPCTT